MNISETSKEVIINIINYVVPIVAIFLSLISLLISSKNLKIQTRVIKLEEKLKSYELNEKEKELAESKIACVEARVYCLSRDKYRLKIWNSGKATAYNVDYLIQDNVSHGIVREFAPYEFLEAGKSFEELVVVHSGTVRKFVLMTTWSDGEGNIFSKDNIITT